MRTRSLIWLAWLALAACSDGSSTPTGGTIVVQNASTHAFDRVFVEPAGTTTLVTQRNATQVAPGATLVVSGLDAGNWDCLVYVNDQGTRFLAPFDAVPVAVGETIPLTVSDSDFLGRFEVTNAGTSDITGVYLALGGGSWGSNTLTTPGSTVTIAPGTALIPSWVFPAATYDLRCDFAGGGQSIGTVVIQSLQLTHVTCPFP